MQLKVDIAAYLRNFVQASLFLDLDQVMMEIGHRAFFRRSAMIVYRHAFRFPRRCSTVKSHAVLSLPAAS